jgi:hypothetical protein
VLHVQRIGAPQTRRRIRIKRLSITLASGGHAAGPAQFGVLLVKVLVAGDAGYIGAVLVPFLRTAGHDVDGLDLRL